MNREEKEKQILEVEGKPITDEETFCILTGEGVEYITDGGLKIYLQPLRIRQYRLMAKLLKQFGDLSDPEKLDNALNEISIIFAELFKVTQDQIEDNCILEDYKIIIGLLATVASEGKNLYKKKELSVKFSN